MAQDVTLKFEINPKWISKLDTLQAKADSFAKYRLFNNRIFYWFFSFWVKRELKKLSKIKPVVFPVN